MFNHSPVGAKVSIARQSPFPLTGNPKKTTYLDAGTIQHTGIEVLVVPSRTVNPTELISDSFCANVNAVHCAIRYSQISNERVFLNILAIHVGLFMEITCLLWIDATVAP